MHKPFLYNNSLTTTPALCNQNEIICCFKMLSFPSLKSPLHSPPPDHSMCSNYCLPLSHSKLHNHTPARRHNSTGLPTALKYYSNHPPGIQNGLIVVSLLLVVSGAFLCSADVVSSNVGTNQSILKQKRTDGLCETYLKRWPKPYQADSKVNSSEKLRNQPDQCLCLISVLLTKQVLFQMSPPNAISFI